jgi:two-component system LytT family sensor kinase
MGSSSKSVISFASKLVGVWCAVVLFTSSQYSLIYTASGGAAHWLMALRVAALQWLPWLVVGPCVIALASRLPLRGPSWPSHLAVHLLATLIAAALVVVLTLPATNRSFGAEYLRNVHSVAIVYWLLVAGTHLADSLRRASDRESHVARLEVQLADARLAALQAQLHPHFLFNTLHAVSSLIHEDPDAAEDMLTALSDLLRTTLGRGNQREVPLHDEIDFLERYLEIQKMRLGDRLHVTLDIASDVTDVLVPSFAIQPLVENAIRYAIAPRRDGGHLEIRAERTADRLRLTVADDGPGLATPSGDGSGWGIGLENTRERLAQLYGDDCRFTIADRPKGGAAVMIDIRARTSSS